MPKFLSLSASCFVQKLSNNSTVLIHRDVPFCPRIRRTCNLTKASSTGTGSSQHERGPADIHQRSVWKSPCTTRTAADPLGSLKPASDQISSVSRDKTKPFVLVDAMSDVTTKKLLDNDGELTIRAGEREVYHSPSSLLGSQESRVHSFAVVDLPPVYFINLKAS